MKKFIIALLISLACVFIIHLTLFDNAYSYQSLSNALFVVGIFMFFIGLIIITEASKMFLIIGYSFKAFIKRKEFKYKSYYDYMKEKQKEKTTPYALQMFIISIGYLVTSYILALQVV